MPVDDVLDEIVARLAAQRTLVLAAPPGTGKTTRVPAALLGAPWLHDHKVVMLEPRRVAARASAERLAAERNESVGGTVGLRTRDDTRCGPDTRLEVVTEGVLTRMLIEDPALSGVGVVVFDEFHERSIHGDTALAFARESAGALRDDLRLVLMSATFDATDLAARLDTDEVVRVEAPLYPVETRYRSPSPGRHRHDDTADAVLEALTMAEGDVLVFLAGAGDIRGVERSLRPRLPDEVSITPLHGALPAGEQDRALLPAADGRRKVVLSTPIAETSVTIDGVRIVIDSGRRRRPEFDIGRGMSGLRTVSASRAATDQRRGRAGRQGPGLCIRLWPEHEQEHRRIDEPPEILTTDLTPLALQIAAWGATDELDMPWIDAPPPAAIAAAREVLLSLGAIDDRRRLTEHGRAMLAIGTEPRLAHMMVMAQELGQGATACDLAAILADRDLFTGRHRPIDLRLRLEALVDPSGKADPGRRRRARALARRWRRHFGLGDAPADPEAVGALVSLAFPERIAQRRRDPGAFLLASGAGAATPPEDELASESMLAVAETEGVGADARILTAAPLDREVLDRLHGDRIETRVRGEWDRRARDAVFEKQDRIGALVLRREPDLDPDRDAVVEALLTGVRREGLALLAWTDPEKRWRERLTFLHQHDPEGWPSVDDPSLLHRLDDWLAPAMGGVSKRTDLEAIDLRAALNNLLDWRRVRDVDRLAPSHLEVPSGSRIPIDYGAVGGPVLAVRLQEVFGLVATPTVMDGTVPIVLHLLSPAHRPVQVTTDLASFWQDGYAEVRRELRGRYPKHEWPEDPSTARPTNRAKRRR